MRKLTNPFVQNVTSVGRYTDSGCVGLHLDVRNERQKYWVFRYTYQGKRTDIHLGSIRIMSLKAARDEVAKIRSDLAWGRAPRNESRQSVEKIPTKIFHEYADQYIKTKSAEWSNKKHIDQWYATIENYVNPVVGCKPVNEIDTSDVLKILTPIWLTKTETASRVRGRVESILSAATVLGLREGPNPAAWKNHLEIILSKPGKVREVQHFSALPYSEVGALFSELNNREEVSAFALKFLILNASRTGEVLGARWEEVEFDKNERLIWSIPSSRMKMRRSHKVPLSNCSVDILRTMGFKPGNHGYIFARNGRALSNAAMSKLLKSLVKGVTVHGFRSAFRDWAAEQTEVSTEVIEMALAHAIGNKVEAAYRRGDLMEKRRMLMEYWERYIT